MAIETHAELHMPATSAKPSMVPKTSVDFAADEPLKLQENASGADALCTLTEMSPGTAAPIATAATTDMLLFAEQSAVKTPSVTPLDGMVIVPEI
jgi:hypothetical protein